MTTRPASRALEFLPKIFTVFAEGYTLRDLRADALAGMTVAIVALSMGIAIAIASGVGPERGLYATIVGGFLVSALGGSRFQIAGPEGAFIVLISGCVAQTGVQGLLLATMLSGLMLLVLGVSRVGGYIRFIPYPVTVGFTAGVGIIIFSSQIKDLFGLTPAGNEPAELFEKLRSLWHVRETFTPASLGLAAGTIAIIQGIKRLRPHLPGMLLAIAAVSVAAAVLDLPVETIGTRFGDLPRTLPVPALPDISRGAVIAALPWAVSFTLLGAIEALLSAIVADGMTGRQHRSNAELVAQGVANMGSALFGGFCVTGTLARTATNIRAGSRGPVSGMLHAVFVLLFMLVAAPLASYIPLAALAGVLAVVAWNMVEKEEFWNLIRTSRGDALVLIVTFLIVVFRDLTEGIVVGFALGGLVFISRMSAATSVEPATPEIPYDPAAEQQKGVVVYRLRGPFFFGAAARLGSVLDRIAEKPRALVVDFTDVPFIDSSGAHSFELLSRKLSRKGGQLYLTGTRPEVRREMHRAGLHEPGIRFMPDVASVEEELGPILG